MFKINFSTKYIILVIGILSTITVFSQNKTVNIDVENKTISLIFDLITSQTGMVFSYDANELDKNARKSLSAKQLSLSEALNKLLLPDYNYKLSGRYIIIKKTPIFPKNAKGIKLEQKYNIALGENGNNVRDSIVLLKKMYLTSGVSIVSCPSNRKTKGEKGTKQTNEIVPVLYEKETPDVSKVISSNNSKKEDSMFKKYVWGLVLAFTTTLPYQAVAEPEPEEPKEYKPAQLTFLYPLGTDGVHSMDYNYNFSINILGGVTNNINGGEFAGLFNINEGGVQGFQTAGLFNKTHFNVNGAQFAGLFNYVGKGTSIFQSAGLFNYSEGSANMQLAGIFNLTQGVSMFQAAGIANSTRQGESKLQLAGIMNNGDTAKVQIAGILNIAKRSRFQLGLVNIRDTADGVSLGLVNIAKKGGILSPGIEVGEFINVEGSFRSGVEKLYSIITFGYNFSNKLMGVGAGLGTTFNLQKHLDLNLELMSYTLLRGGNKEFNERFNGLHQITPIITYKISEKYKLFAGPSFNLLFSKNTENKDLQINAPYSMFNTTSGNNRWDGWIGIKAGFRF